jgi:hypothetical protein
MERLTLVGVTCRDVISRVRSGRDQVVDIAV